MEITIIDQSGAEKNLQLIELVSQLSDQAGKVGETTFQPTSILEKTQKYLEIFQMGLQKSLSVSQLSELLANICREEGYLKLAAELLQNQPAIYLQSKTSPQTQISKSNLEKMRKLYLPHTRDASPETLIKKIASINCPAPLAKSIEQLISQNRFLPHPNILKENRPFDEMQIHLQDSLGDIFDQLKQAAINFQNLTATTINFSSLRPKMSLIKSTQGFSSGPVSFIKIYTSTFEALRQNLSADYTPLQTFILNIHHPDILEFLIFIKNFQKNSLNKYLEFLIELTPPFLDALGKEEDFELINPENSQTVNLLSAKNSFDLIISTILENPALGLTITPTGQEVLDVPLYIAARGPTPHHQIAISGLVNFAGYAHDENSSTALIQDLATIQQYLEHQKSPVSKQNPTPATLKLSFTGWNDFLIGQNLAFGSVASLELAEQLFSQIRAAVSPDIQLEINLRSPLLNLLESTRGAECLDQLATQKTNLDGQEIYQLHPALREQLTALGLAQADLIKQIYENNSLADFYQIPVQTKNLFKTAREISPDFHLQLQRLLEKQLNSPVEKKIYFGSSLDLERIKAAVLREMQAGIHHIRLCQFDTPGKTEGNQENSSDRNFLLTLGKNKKRRHREIQPPLFQIRKTEEITLPPIST